MFHGTYYAVNTISQSGVNILHITMHEEEILYKKILWFNKRLHYEIDFFDLLQPQRLISKHQRYKSGTFYSEKCKRSVQYESGIELDFILKLEQLENVLFYYEQPVKIPYRCGRRKRTYTPDFGLYLDTGEFVIVEIKDLPSMLEDKVQMKIEALLDFCSKKGFGLLFFDGKNTFDKLLKIKNNRKLEKAILNALDEGPLKKEQYNEIARECRSTHKELLKIIIRHNLKFRQYPFRLRQGNKNDLFRQVFVEKRKYDELMEERLLKLFR